MWATKGERSLCLTLIDTQEYRGHYLTFNSKSLSGCARFVHLLRYRIYTEYTVLLFLHQIKNSPKSAKCDQGTDKNIKQMTVISCVDKSAEDDPRSLMCEGEKYKNNVSNWLVLSFPFWLVPSLSMNWLHGSSILQIPKGKEYNWQPDA